jgi:hypothetical protein
MAPLAIGVSGTIGNGTWCTIVAPSISVSSVPQSAVTGGTQFGSYPGSMLDLATYDIQLGAGVTAGTLTFQELFADLVTWIPLINPVALSLVTATAAIYNGILNGPFLGLRFVVTGITGGTIAQAMLKASVRSI